MIDFYFKEKFPGRTNHKYDSYTVQDILLNVEPKGTKSQIQERKRFEASFQSLQNRYSTIFEQEEPVETKKNVKPVLDTTKVLDEVEEQKSVTFQLARRMTSLQGSIALEKAKSKLEAVVPEEEEPEEEEEEDEEGEKKEKKKKKLAPKATPHIMVPMGKKYAAWKKPLSRLRSEFAKQRWKVAIGMIMSLARMTVQAKEEKKIALNIADIIFDPGILKFDDNGVGLTQESKITLTLTPVMRTVNQINRVIKNIEEMGITSFNEFPLDIKRKIIQVAHFSVVTPQRALTKQGRPSENFFILMDGSVVAIEKSNQSDKVDEGDNLIILRKGAIFGESEMANRLPRKSTIITKASVELLTIERQELIKTLVEYPTSEKIPKHIKFIENCEFIDLWPTELLDDNLINCAPYFFRSNSVIIEDSMKTDYLAIIMSGRCRVISKVHKILSKEKERSEQESRITKDRLIDYKNELMRENFRNFSRQGSQYNTVFKGDKFERNLKTSIAVDQVIDENRIPAHVHSPSDIQYPAGFKRSASRAKEEMGNLSVPPSKNYSRHVSKMRYDMRRQDSGQNKFQLIKSRSKDSMEKALMHPKENVRSTDNETENNKVLLFIQLDTLKENDVFGLNTLVFDNYYDQPPNKGLSLLSDDDEAGVMVVLLSKKFFVENAGEQVAWRVRKLMKEYPDPDTILKEMERQEWLDTYKDDQRGEDDEALFTKPIFLKKESSS